MNRTLLTTALAWLFSTLCSAQDFIAPVGVHGFGFPDVSLIQIDSMGNRYMGGEAGNFIFIQDSVEKLGEWRDHYVAKVNDKGELLWLRTFGSDYSEDLADMVVDEDGNCHITGSINDSLIFYPRSSGEFLYHRRRAQYYVKFSPEGKIVEKHLFTDVDNSVLAANIALGPDKEVYLTGQTKNGFLVKQLPLNGHQGWEEYASGDGFVHDVVVDKNGDVCVAASSNLGLRFGKTFGGRGQRDGYVVVLDKKGNYKTGMSFLGNESFSAFFAPYQLDIYEGTIGLACQFHGTFEIEKDTLLNKDGFTRPAIIMLKKSVDGKQLTYQSKTVFGKYKDMELADVKFNNRGEVYAVGTHTWGIEVDTLKIESPAFCNLLQAYLLKLDQTGKVQYLLSPALEIECWSGESSGLALGISSNNRIAIGGDFIGEVHFSNDTLYSQELRSSGFSAEVSDKSFHIEAKGISAQYCLGRDTLKWEISGANFYAGNEFAVYLSGKDSNFRDTTFLGRSTGGQFQVPLPGNLVEGQHYRALIISNAPQYKHYSQRDISLKATPSKALQIVGPDSVYPSNPYTYSIKADSGVTYDWKVENGEILREVDSATVEISWKEEGAGKVTVVASLNGSCPGAPYALDVKIYRNIGVNNAGRANWEVFYGMDNKHLHVRMEADNDHTIKVYSQQGSLVYTGKLHSSGHSSIGTTSWSPGVYLVSVESAHTVLTQKFLKPD